MELIHKLKDILADSQASKNEVLDLSVLELENIPNLENYDWVRSLILRSNRLSRIDLASYVLNSLNLNNNNFNTFSVNWVPVTLKKLYIQHNSLKEFDGSQLVNLKVLCLGYNMLSEFTFPPNLVECRISFNRLPVLNSVPLTLEKLDCSNNNIVSFKNSPNLNIRKLDVSNNRLTYIPTLDKLTHLDISNNAIYNIYKFPPDIINLNLSGNNLNKIQTKMPNSLRYLDVSCNKIHTFPELNEHLIELDISDNNIKYIDTKDVSFHLEKLNCGNNPNIKIDGYLFERSLLQITGADVSDSASFVDTPMPDAKRFQGAGKKLNNEPANNYSNRYSYTTHNNVNQPATTYYTSGGYNSYYNSGYGTQTGSQYSSYYGTQSGYSTGYGSQYGSHSGYSTGYGNYYGSYWNNRTYGNNGGSYFVNPKTNNKNPHYMSINSRKKVVVDD